MEKTINKKDMYHIGGTIYNCAFDAQYVLLVLNEKNQSLKFAYNIGHKTLSVLDFKKEFNTLTIKYN